MSLRRVAADLDRGWDDFLQGTRTPDNEEFAGEEFAGCMLAAPILRALAAELVSCNSNSRNKVPGAAPGWQGATRENIGHI